MQAIVSLLDTEHCEKLEAVWHQLREEFGTDSKYTRFLPHFTYQVADAYCTPEVAPVLQEFAAAQEPLTIQTAGLGIFSRPHTVVYLPVVRNTELTLFHHRIWQKMEPLVKNESPMYHPDRWLPHITLTYGDLPRVTRFRIIEFLAQQDLNWEISINNLSLIDDTVLDDAAEYHYHLGNAGNT